MPISQNDALYGLLGITFGGDGRVNFGLPNLQGRTPMHVSSEHPLGEQAGAEAVTVTLAQLPAHVHALNATSVMATTNTPSNTTLTAQSTSANLYAAAGNLMPMSPAAVANVGGNQPHPNMQPFLTLNFCIALQGTYPES